MSSAARRRPSFRVQFISPPRGTDVDRRQLTD
jgi:hypothetical protein